MTPTQLRDRGAGAIILLCLAGAVWSTLFKSEPSQAAAPTLTLPIVGGIDGDTISTTLPLPCPLCRASVRVRGVDTPEKSKARAKCGKEIELAHNATAVTKDLIGSATTMTLRNFKWDKYGGRIDADVTIS